MNFQFWPKAMRELGDDPVKLLQTIWDWGMRCYDMNTHPGYRPTGLQGGIGRPSDILGFVRWLEAVPIVSFPCFAAVPA
jgi:hypothetical protein